MTSKPDKATSLEAQLKLSFFVFAGIFVLGLNFILYLLNVSALVLITANSLLTIPFFIWLALWYQQIIKPFYRLTSVVEAIRLEDYSLRAAKHYKTGIIGNLYDEVATLSESLQQRKQVYDQQVFLIYHLIEQLDTPIAVFNERLRLTHANAAFSTHINQPWQSLRQSSSQRLGLVLNDEQNWQFSSDEENSHWQIRQSQFVQQEQNYHLLVLNNIEKELRQNQQQSWQQIIRVLSHEITNSLTPIKSLAQSLAELPELSTRSREALDVIVARSSSLQEFIGRYSALDKRLSLNPGWIQSTQWLASISGLFSSNNILISNDVEQFWGDPVLLEQVLINLIKNAIEATADSTAMISVRLYKQRSKIIIDIKDQGQGIANPKNIFVPFYTTKENGRGIGLRLCQNIVEHHHGTLQLSNNTDGPGAHATVILPSVENKPVNQF